MLCHGSTFSWTELRIASNTHGRRRPRRQTGSHCPSSRSGRQCESASSRSSVSAVLCLGCGHGIFLHSQYPFVGGAACSPDTTSGSAARCEFDTSADRRSRRRCSWTPGGHHPNRLSTRLQRGHQRGISRGFAHLARVVNHGRRCMS